MKKLVLILIGFCLFTNLKAQNSYYWYNNTKQVLNKDKSRTFITVKNLADAEKVTNELESLNIKVDDFQSIYLSSGIKNDDNKYWTYIYSSDFNSDLIVYSGPSYILENNTHVAISHLFYVKVKSLDDVDLLDSMAEVYNVSILGNNQFMPKWYTLSVTSKSSGNTLDIANRFFESGLFENATPDIMTDDFINCATDSLFTYQWGLKNIGQSGGIQNVDINWCDVKQLTTGNSNIIIAVLDHGIQSNHPDIINLCNISFDSETGTSPSITRGPHGTQCAGIIGATTDNNLGISGISSSCKLMSISNSFAQTPDSRMKRADGINFAWRNGASIISNSWTSPIQYTVIDDAINLATTQGRNGKGCVVSFSSGNNNINQVEYPSSLPNVISVGAMSPCGERKSPTSCDGETSWGSNYGSGLDVVAPGVQISTTNINSGYVNDFNGTSAACPHVAGVAALMLSVNPNLTAAKVKNIIEQTAREVGIYYYDPDSSSHPNKGWCSQMGYGLVDAYAAVKKAMEVDLYVSDTAGDNGADDLDLDCEYNSPDIWIETDGNPVGGRTYNVCVRIHNKSDVPSIGTERLFLNWAKAGVNLPWPNAWNGNTSLDCADVPMGGLIKDTLLPVINPGSSVVVKIPWMVPDGNEYDCGIFAGSAEQWHFCLLARVHDSETIRYEDSDSCRIDTFVVRNNNVAWKNLTVIDGSNNKAVVWLQNHFNTAKKFRLHFTAHRNSKNESLSEYAETYIRLSPNVFKAWSSGGKKGNGISVVGENRLRITSDNATLENIPLPANAVGMLETEVNFLSEVIPQGKTFTFDIAMYDSNGKTLYGGEHYMAIRDDERTFDVVAMQNQTAMPEEPVTFSAVNIGEPATYLWYNAAGDSIGSGTTLSTTATQSQQYRLSVQATADGYKGYDTVSVVVRNGAITSLSPNPATNQVVVSYALSNQVQGGTVQIANTNGVVLLSTPFTATQTSTTLNLQNLVAGRYSVRLVSATGEVLDSKTLIVQ